MNICDIEKLYTAGLISKDQRDKITAQFFPTPKQEINPPGRAFVYFLAVLAAILITTGALLLAISYWQEITPFMKSAAGILIMILAWIGRWRLREKKPMVSEGLALLGVGMWGANIVLINHQFSLGLPAVECAFLFYAGALPIPFLIHHRILLGVAFAFSLIMLPLMDSAPESSWLALPWLHTLKGSAISLLSSILLIWWMVGEKSRLSKGVCEGYYWVSFPAFAIFLLMMQSVLLYTPAPLATIEHNWIICVAPMLFIPLLKPANIPWAHWVMVALSSCLLPPLAIHLSWHTAYHEIIGMFTCAIYCGIFMMASVRNGRHSWLYVSISISVFIFFDLLVRISESFEDSGLFLISTGVAVLAFAYALDKQRSYLIHKMKERPLPPIPPKEEV